MQLSSLLGALASLCIAVSARQFSIPEVDAAVQKALQANPEHVAYTGPVKPSPKGPAPNAAASASYWLESIAHQGFSAFGPGGYQVWRNVRDYGARGDGVTDDTAAVQAAIAAGGRCGRGCASSTTTPALVYFPAGTYIISSPIFDYYYTQLIGNPNERPTLKAAAGFNGGYIIDADPYYSVNPNWATTNVFNRQVRNIIFDTTAVPPGQGIAGIHWPTSQATSMQNCVFQMSSASGTKHVGIFQESGSAGLLNDLVFNGGNVGLSTGNQQYTVRNLVFNGCVTAISQLWDWSFTYKSLTINNCQTGIDITATNGALFVGAVTVLDSTFTNTGVAIKTGWTPNANPPTANSVILENVVLQNVGTAVQNNGNNALGGGSTTISAWGQGHRYNGNGALSPIQGSFGGNPRPAQLLQGGGKYYERSKPQYEGLPASSFRSVRSAGARGDGRFDDTDALQNVINSAASSGQVVFFDAGTYRVTRTLSIPPGSKLVGEAYPVIMSSGGFFGDMNNPRPVVQVGTAGQSGQVEWSDMIVAAQGAQAGATLIEWNLATSGTPSGMWDVHTRVGGFAGSNLQAGQCPKTPGNPGVNGNCIGAYMHMHITASATNLYMENNWLWTADHDIEDPNNTQITVYTGRGLLVDSSNGVIWLSGASSEHSVLYQYQFANTRTIYAGFLQTETPYFQPTPNALTPFPPNGNINDPDFARSCAGQGANCAVAWGLRVLNTQNLFIYGAGLYAFFNDYGLACSTGGGAENCQNNMVDFSGNDNTISIYNLATIGATNMITRDGRNVVARYSDNVNVYPDLIALFNL